MNSAFAWKAMMISLVVGNPVFSQQVTRVADINPGAGGSFPCYLTVFNDALYFRANGTPHTANSELWRYGGHGEGTVVFEINPGDAGSSPTDLTVHDNRLYFAARGATGGMKLWQCDGSNVTLAPGAHANAGNPQALFVFDDVLYFRAFRSDLGVELWRFDGSTQIPMDFRSGTGSAYPKHFLSGDGNLYFNASIPPVSGSELFKLAGEQAIQLTDIRPGHGSSPEHPVSFKGSIYFSAHEDLKGRELWKWDETGATRIADIAAGQASSNPSSMTVYKDAIYFCADDGIHGAELWRYDGQAATLVADINQTPYVPDIDPVHHSWPAHFFVFKDTLYFTADDGIHGNELWTHDGAATQLAADIFPGPFGSYAQEFTVFQNTLHFTANDGQSGGELGEMVVMKFSDEPITRFQRGDANQDGAIDLSDAIRVLLYLYADEPAPQCLKSIDANDSGKITLADPIYLLAYLFADGPDPASPFEGCSEDLTEDGLSCEHYSQCSPSR